MKKISTRILTASAIAILAFTPQLAHADFYNPPSDKGERHSFDGPGSPRTQVPYGFDRSRDQNTVTVVTPTGEPGIVMVSEEDRRELRSYLKSSYRDECPASTKKVGRECDTGATKSHIVVGQPLPVGMVYDPVPNEVITVMKPVPTGYRYVRYGNDVYLISTTNVVTDVITYESY